MCSWVPNSVNTSMWPASGALQVHASEAMWLRPVISASGAYSSLVNPGPTRDAGEKGSTVPARLRRGVLPARARRVQFPELAWEVAVPSLVSGVASPTSCW